LAIAMSAKRSASPSDNSGLSLQRMDSHAGANMIQAPYWEEASMDGEAVFGGLA
jgi:hypothetical protein